MTHERYTKSNTIEPYEGSGMSIQVDLKYQIFLVFKW
jgi:hypothetical protein